MKPLVSIIIVNWNGRDIIQECLQSIFTQDYTNIEVILLDNNSSDDSVSLIKNKYKHVILIENSKNDGFAKGNNIACKKAKGKYVFLVNSDAFLTNNCLERLVTRMERDRTIGVVQPKILYKGSPFYQDGAINSIGSFFTSTGFLYHIGYGKNRDIPLYNKETEIFTAFGACMLIRNDLIKKIGLFDEDYFAYFEESDFCSRAWLNGNKILYFPDATAFHRGGVSARKYGIERVYYHSFKNRICTYLKNLEPINCIKILSVHIILCECMSLFYSISGKPIIGWAIQRALYWNIFMVRKTLMKRKKIQQKYRVYDDKQIFSLVKKDPRMSYYLYLLKGLEYYKD